MKTVYYLECEDSNKMKEYLNILFKNGFVVGFTRMKTIEKVEKACGNLDYLYYIGFKYLIFGADSQCSKVITLSKIPWRDDITTIEEFLKLDY